jgi:5'-nucleotidase (lipoprotein e(P4) family)
MLMKRCSTKALTEPTACWENISYPSQWDNGHKGIAEAIARHFSLFDYVSSNSAEVFYVSNRMEDQRQGTLKNLKEKGFPFADNQHLMLKTVSTTKEIYRQQIAGKYHISLLIGDNLSDFISGFDKQPAGTRYNCHFKKRIW